MADENEVNEYISLEEIPQRDSPSAPSPSGDGHSAVTEDAIIDENSQTGENDGHDDQGSPSIEVSEGPDSSGKEEGDSPGERVAEPHGNARIVAVTPQPGNASPDVKSDHDSGVKIDNDDDDDPASKTPDKPVPAARTPSVVSSEAASSRSASPDDADHARSAYAPPSRAAPQPPRFKNDVEPMEYQRPAAPVGYNRAVHSVQCKAMLIIMGTCILAVVVIICFIILNGGSDDVPKPTPTALDGIFNITNRLFVATYADSNSTEYRQLSEEFINTMNTTFQSSEDFYMFYEKTTVNGIEHFNDISVLAMSRPTLDFTLYLVIPASDLIGQDEATTQASEVTGSSLVSDPMALGNTSTLIDDVINYLVHVTESGKFGSFTGKMEFTEI